MKKIHLDNLPLGTYGKVDTLNCEGAIRRRLLDLGIVQGTKILPVLKSPSGDPTAFAIRGSLIALRKEDAKLILVTI
ncbi:MAG: ferrous iron transport protein A [Clostridia bacterium]|nr:ferrous iron transport protein A [Clostridia bacterium]